MAARFGETDSLEMQKLSETLKVERWRNELKNIAEEAFSR